MFVSLLLRDGPLEKLWWGGGGGGRSTKKKSCKGKLSEKNSRTASSPEKALKYGKKYSCKGNVNKTIRAARKFPTPLPP